MKKLLSALIALTTCLSLSVNVQAKQSKMDQVVSYIKKKQYNKAVQLNNSLPFEYKTTGKLTAKAKKLYKAKLKSGNYMRFWYYDVTNDKKADFFVKTKDNYLNIYTIKRNKVVTLLHDRINPNFWIIASPGTKHFYIVNQMDDGFDYIYKTTYKNKKFHLLTTTKLPKKKSMQLSFAPHYGM